jgi:HK97 family phage major capsid protein
MSIEEVTKRVHSMGQAWEQFKHVNDSRLNDIERKGNADPLYGEHLQRIGDALDNQKTRMDRLETANSRPELDGFGAKMAGVDVSEYRTAFTHYLRKGMDHDLEQLELKTLSATGQSGAEGGYLITPQMSDKITSIINETSPLRTLATVETISSDTLDLIEDSGDMQAVWVDESEARLETANPLFNKHTIETHEMYANPRATQKLIDDASIDIEAWVAQKVAERFARLEATAFISGDGIKKPTGILSYPDGTASGQVEQLVSATIGAIDADDVVKLYYGLKDEYAKGASFLMHRTTVQGLRLLKENTTGQYLWQPGLAQGTPDTLMGVPVALASDMPAANAGALAVAVGDFKRAYIVVDRVGIRMLRDPYTAKPFVLFYTTKRVGGEVVNSEAMKLLKVAV